MSSHQTENLIIGAGIVGLATAYYLKKLALDKNKPLMEPFKTLEKGKL